MSWSKPFEDRSVQAVPMKHVYVDRSMQAISAFENSFQGAQMLYNQSNKDRNSQHNNSFKHKYKASFNPVMIDMREDTIVNQSESALSHHTTEPQ
jgi:hypothetical protein